MLRILQLCDELSRFDTSIRPLKWVFVADVKSESSAGSQADGVVDFEHTLLSMSGICHHTAVIDMDIQVGNMPFYGNGNLVNRMDDGGIR